MFTPFVRLFILIFLAVAAVIMANRGNFTMLILASGISLFLLWDYTSRGTVPLALRSMMKHDINGAEKHLAYINRPQILNKENQAKYYMVKGMVAHHKDNFAEAEENLEIALAIPLKSKNLRVMTLLTLTDINIILKRKTKAKDFFQQLNGMKIAKSLIPTVTKLEDYLGRL